MIGKRCDNPDGLIPNPGDYGKGPDGHWFGSPPNTDLTANLSSHFVIEHEDGTITVEPSILIRAPHRNAEWHGYLTGGVWREV